jgi:hypothetical protein
LSCSGKHSQTIERKEASHIVAKSGGNTFSRIALISAAVFTCDLFASQSWRVILGIIDGVLYAYDAQFYQQLATVADSRGCHLYSANEAFQMVVIANKKKLSQYQWQDSMFQLRKEFTLIDIPKNIYYLRGSVVIAYKKYYECLDLNSGGTSRILDVEKDHKMVIAEVSVCC